MRKHVKQILSVLLSVVMIAGLVPLIDLPQADAATSTWDGSTDTSFAGSGTAASPYVISSAAELAGLASLTNSTANYTNGKRFVLTTDIDLNNREWTPIGIQYDGSSSFSDRWFNGTFDGNGHKIYNLKIGTSSSRTKKKHVGLFGICNSSSEIFNLGLETVSIYTQHMHNDDRRGGFVGYTAGYIMGCYARNVTVNDSGTCVIGGFVGQVAGDRGIHNCYVYNATLSVGGGRKGGFVGDNGDDATCSRSFCNYYPFVAQNDGTCSACYGETSVYGDSNTYGSYMFQSSSNNGGWPQLSWQAGQSLDYSGGKYHITNAAQMWTFSKLAAVYDYENASISLDADISLSAYGTGWTPIGDRGGTEADGFTSFKGKFYGNGHVISDMKIGTGSSRSGAKFIGLFSYATDSAGIYDLGMKNCYVYQNHSTDPRGGIIIGRMNGSGGVHRCFVTGSTVSNSGTGVVGALVGALGNGSGSVTDCYSANCTATATRGGAVVGDVDSGSSSALYSYGANCSSNKVVAQGNNSNSYYNQTSSTTNAQLGGYYSTSYWCSDVYNSNNGYIILKSYRDQLDVTLNFNANGGSVSPSSKTGDWGTTTTLPTPTRTGYSCNGWYTASSGGSKVGNTGATITFGTTVPTAANQTSTVYAQWTANKYTVTLNNQSATGAGTTSVQATYDSAMPSITVPTKTGYTFGGYYDQTGGNGTQYYTASGASARTWNKTSAATLYAKWTPKTYTVSLDNQSATTAGTTVVTATYDAAMPNATMPAKTGYTFGGYYDQTGGNGTQYYTAAGASARTWNKATAYTLYAKWTAIPYTVTVTPGTGVTVSGVTSGTYDYGTTFTVTVAAQPAYNKSTPKLYVNGTETASGSVITVTGDTAITTNSLELNKYTVRFFDKNEHEMAVYTQQVSHGSDATLPPAQNGYTDGLAHYTFDGWSGYTGITADTDIYASFTRTEHVFDQQNTDGFYLKKAATCTAPAQYYYSCVCGVRTSSYFEYGSAQGHDMTPTAAKPATCTEPGNSAYWYCGRCEKYFSDANGNNEIAANSWILSATGHETYVEGAWTWTPVEGGGYTATVVVTCAKDDDTRTLTANVGLTEDVAAQHLVDGHKKYTATASIGNQTFTDEKTDVIEAEGHSTVHHDAVPSAKCTETGTIEYWSCAGCEMLFSDAEAQNVITSISDNTYGDHAYAFSTFVWSADGKTAQAKYVCGNDTDHIDLRTAAMSEDAHAPTCTADGYTDYTATYDGHTDTNRVAGDSATGHVTYVAGEWTWTPAEGGGYTATVAVDCAKEDDPRTLIAVVELTDSKDVTHLVDGYKTYTATATIGNQTFTDEKTDTIYAEGHTTVHHDAVPSAKCTETGTIEYWSCEGCEMLFSDAEAQNVITSISDGTYGDHAYAFDSFVWAADGKTAQAKYVCGNNPDHIDLRTAAMSEDAHAPTCTADGYTDYTASYDGHTDTNRVAGDAATGHETYFEGEWTWTPKEGGGYTATVAVDCAKEDDPRTLTAVVDLTDSKDVTHLVDGYKTYTATASIGNQTFTDEKTDTIYAEGHTTVHHDAVPSAKCTETGTIEYWSCEGCDKLFSDAEAQNVITSISDGVYGDHAYAFSTFVWAADGTTAQAKYVCGNDEEHIDLRDAEMSEESYGTSCTAGGYTVFTATYDGHTDTNRVDGSAASGHVYAAPSEDDWTWTKTEDGYDATVDVVCVREDDTQTLTAVVALTEDVAAQHLVDGHKKYTATATIGNQTFTATKTDVIEAEGHTTVHHDAVPSAKCTETGTIEYWSCTGCDMLFSDADAQNTITNLSDGTYGNHAYAFDSFVWAADGKTAQAKYICGNNAEHVDLKDAEMSEDAHAPTCTAAGYTDYTATYDGHTDTNRVAGDAATGHVTYVEGEWTWTPKEGGGYTATVAVDCAKEDDPRTLTANVELTDSKDVTHLEDGYKTYTATAIIGDQTFTDEKTDVIKAEGHTTVHHDAVPSAKCTETGTIEYWSCEGCDKLFSDAEAQNVITSISDGVYGAHAYGEWTKISDSKHQRVCANDPDHVETEGHVWDNGEETLAPTCTSNGTVTYRCTKCDATKTATIAAPGHKWNKGEVTKPATTTETGEKTYTCERCGETRVETIAKAGACKVCGAAHNKNLLDRILGLIHAIWYYFLILERTF